MNVLEKILEEIERLEDPYYKDYVDRKHVEEIIRSHMDDGKDTNVPGNDKWILCKDNMPTKDMDGQPVWITYGSLGNLSTVFAYCDWVSAQDENGDDDSNSEFYIDQYPQLYYPSANLVHAWKPAELPEPYKPEEN